MLRQERQYDWNCVRWAGNFRKEYSYKSNANKIRKIGNGTVLIGFAGSVADALTLADKLDTNLEKYNYNLMRACIEVAKLWRSDKILRNLEAMLIAANLEQMYVLSGTGDVIEPEHNVIAIGSGGNYAYAAGLAFVRSNVDKNAVEIAKESVKIAGEMCVFTNTNISSDFLVK